MNRSEEPSSNEHTTAAVGNQAHAQQKQLQRRLVIGAPGQGNNIGLSFGGFTTKPKAKAKPRTKLRTDSPIRAFAVANT
eukprot:5541450-Heterocapsa_arctica.AAC.1